MAPLECARMSRTVQWPQPPSFVADQRILPTTAWSAAMTCDFSDDRYGSWRMLPLSTGRRGFLSTTEKVAVSSCELVIHQAVDDPVNAWRQPEKHHPDEVDLVRQGAPSVQPVDDGNWQVAGREGEKYTDDGLQQR